MSELYRKKTTVMKKRCRNWQMSEPRKNNQKIWAWSVVCLEEIRTPLKT